MITANTIKYTPINSNDTEKLNNNHPRKTKILLFRILLKNLKLTKQSNFDRISSTISLLKTKKASNISHSKSSSSSKISRENLIPKFFHHNNLSIKIKNKPQTPVVLTAFKIQSENSLRACYKRRQLAIRRCLLLATMQLILNLPNYVLQLVDEFTLLRQTSRRFAVFYLYADAIFYLFYLSQYPMIAVYVRWFHNNMGLAKSASNNQNKFKVDFYKQNFNNFISNYKAYKKN